MIFIVLSIAGFYFLNKADCQKNSEYQIKILYLSLKAEINSKDVFPAISLNQFNSFKNSLNQKGGIQNDYISLCESTSSNDALKNMIFLFIGGAFGYIGQSVLKNSIKPRAYFSGGGDLVRSRFGDLGFLITNNSDIPLVLKSAHLTEKTILSAALSIISQPTSISLIEGAIMLKSRESFFIKIDQSVIPSNPFIIFIIYADVTLDGEYSLSKIFNPLPGLTVI